MSSNRAFTQSASDRGIFDENLPLQGIFDSLIFDTQLSTATVTHIILPAFVHSNSEKTALIHGTETKIIK